MSNILKIIIKSKKWANPPESALYASYSPIMHNREMYYVPMDGQS